MKSESLCLDIESVKVGGDGWCAVAEAEVLVAETNGDSGVAEAGANDEGMAVSV